MRRSWVLAVAVAALALPVPLIAAEGQARVRMAASATRVSIVRTFKVQVTVEGAAGAPETPKLEGDGFQVLDVSPSQQQSIVIDNRQRRQTVTYSFIFTLKPLRPGTIAIPPVSVKVGDRTLKSANGIQVEVESIKPQDDLVLELQGPPKAVTIGQEFDVVLKIHARRLDGQYRDLDPFPQRGETWPRLQIPWFEGQEGFETGDFQAFARSLISRSDGFPINNYSSGAGFFSESAALFRFPRTEEKRAGLDGKEYDCLVYTLEKRFRAQKTGVFYFGDVVASGTIYVGKGGEPRPTSVIARSEPLEVVVKAPPEEGRPATYTGAVGRWTATASVKPTKLRVGDPMTLTVTVQGEGALDLIAPPPLAGQEGFESVFRIHEEPKTGESNPARKAKTFTYGIRPKTSAVKAVPPVAFSYFDPADEKYVTVKTPVLPIAVEEARSGGTEAFDLQTGREKTQVKVLDQPLYGVYAEPDALTSDSLPAAFGPAEAASTLTPPAAAAIVMALAARRRRLKADPAILRARKAHRRAAEVLREATAAMDRGDGPAVLGALCRAVAVLIGDRLGIPPAGMTAPDAAEALRVAGADEGLVRTAVEVFERADGARYGAAGGSRAELEAQIEEVRRLLKDLGSLTAAKLKVNR